MEERARRRESGGERRAGEKTRPKNIKTVSPAMGLPPKVKSTWYPHQGSGLETSFPRSDPSRGGSVSALYDWLGALPFLVEMHLFGCAWPKQGLPWVLGDWTGHCHVRLARKRHGVRKLEVGRCRLVSAGFLVCFHFWRMDHNGDEVLRWLCPTCSQPFLSVILIFSETKRSRWALQFTVSLSLLDRCLHYTGDSRTILRFSWQTIEAMQRP
jgi:hypothetical protein